jgi:RsiW-degrading membrane proteinase PrsW (M82 family)
MQGGQSQLTWRRGLVAFCGGATVSVFLALVLEILLPVVVLALIFTTHSVWDRLSILSTRLVGPEAGQALTDPAFVYIFIQVAVIAPLVEELVKPLVTLPLLRQLNRQETFWVGALAGAGFAALENVIYAGSGFGIWAGILVVRALGGALHPLGSGLVALGWRDVLRGEPNALTNWVKKYALAVLIHAAWNGGSLLVITLGSAQFFGAMPPEIGVLGLSMGGTTLAFLLILGIAALWIGRAYGHNRPLTAAPATDVDSASNMDFAPSERAMALWGLACLLALVPMGIAGLKLWLH